MGLIQAVAGAAGGVMADQWKEFFVCDSIPNDVLMVKGVKRTGSRSSNTKGEDNVITSGSGIQVADGQCMIVVEQGVIVECCAEPGTYTYDNKLAPTIFTGNLGESLKETFATIGKRITMGGDTGVDQRVYYFNTKFIMDNKFGTPSPIPFRVVDSNIGLDIDVDLRCSGVYSYRITDPMLFYKNLAGNITKAYTREEIDGHLKTAFINSLSVAMSRISAMEVRPSDIPAHQIELCDFMNEALSKKWGDKGITITEVELNPINLSEEDRKSIKELQLRAVNRDLSMAGATLVGAAAKSMQDAAANSAGAMTGFMGMGMAMNQMGNAAGMAGQLFQMDQQQKMMQQQAAMAAQAAPMAAQAAPVAGQAAPAPGQAAPAGDSWKCSCGHTATGKFCTECGSPKPAAAPAGADTGSWMCSCGTANTGRFCMNCGAKKPAGVPQYKCDKCGWVPADPTKPPKFCPECGDPFGDEDIVG